MDHDDHLDRPATVGWRPRFQVELLLALGLVVAIFVGLWWAREPLPSVGDCPPRPTAALPFDPADGQQLAAHATDIFVGRVVDIIAGKDPASPIPGAPPEVPARHLVVEVHETQKGAATGTVVVHQAIQQGIEGCHAGVAGDFPLDVGHFGRFVAVRDVPTGTYSLFAGPYSHGPAGIPLGAITPPPTPTATAAR